MKANKIPEDIRDYLHHETGELYWTKKPSKQVKIGDEAGCIHPTGYKQVKFRGKSYRVHRVVWFLVKDEQPPEVLDHINNDKLDNRIENLREASISQNGFNAKIPKNNTSGVKGVSWHKQSNKWLARLHSYNKPIHLGSFTDLEDASNAVRETRQKLHGKYTNHG